MSEPAETYEEYTVYVDTGPDDDRFIELCKTIPSIELSWKDTHDI